MVLSQPTQLHNCMQGSPFCQNMTDIISGACVEYVCMPTWLYVFKPVHASP